MISTYTKLSPNCSKPRSHDIDTITPHVYVGDVPVESMLEWLASPKAKASANYCIDSKGRIGLGVAEENRSWCSSSSSNDNRAITCEIANVKNAPNYDMSDKAIKAFIDLSVDLCKRYNKTELYFENNPKSEHKGGSTMRITLHRWFKNKECPGNYFISKIPYICSEVNKQLAPKRIYRVQVGAFSVKANADAMAKKLKAAGYDTIIV